MLVTRFVDWLFEGPSPARRPLVFLQDASAKGPDRQHLAQRLAVPVAVCVSAFTFCLLQVLHRLIPATGADFRAVYRGAASLALGHTNIYAPAVSFLNGGNLRHILTMPTTPYVYPPPLAIVLQPLTLLGPDHALMAWDLLNVAMQGVLFVLVVRLTRARTFGELVLAAAVYGFYPLNMGLGNGQVDLLITVAGLASYLLYRSDRPVIAGVMLGAAILIKPTFAVVLLYFAIRRAWPILLSAGAVVGGGVVISAVYIGQAVLFEYRTIAEGWTNAFGVLPLNQSLHGLIARLLSPAQDVPAIGSSGMVSLISELALPVIGLVITVRILQNKEPRSILKGAIQFYTVFAIMMLASPFTENLHLTWILPGAALLLVMMAQDSRPRIWHVVVIATYLLLALPNTEQATWDAGTTIVGRLSSGLECYGLVALCGVLYYIGFRCFPADSQTTRNARRRDMLPRKLQQA